MGPNIIRFPRRDVALMAEFCAELERLRVVFNAYSTGDDFIVEITGVL